MIQAYYKYRPASFEALALLVCADGKDRLTQIYTADMLRLIASTRYEGIKPLHEWLRPSKKKKLTADKARSFVDDMIRTFGKAG